MTPTLATPAAEPSMGDLRAMLAGSEPTEPKTEAPAPAKAEPATEAVEEAAETKQQPTEDEPLPEGVQKKIAQEVARQAKADRAILEAVSNRKAAEDKLAKLTDTGSQPAPTSASEKKAPEFGEKGHEGETYTQFQVREREHLRAEILAETRKTVEQEFTARQQEAAGKAARAAGTKAAIDAGAVKDAAEFESLLESAQGIAPEALQRVIGSLNDWSLVAVHLAKAPAKLKELVAEYEANPVQAIAKLGRIEASLKSATKPAAERLPDPPAKDGGGSSASSGAFDIEGAKLSQLRRHAVKLGLRKAG